MKSIKYFTKNIDNQWEQIDPKIADDVIKQYFERRYIWTVGIGMFIIGFLFGIIAS
jgi:hypothetical protein